MKFYNIKWEGYEIEAGASIKDVRFFPIFFWLPYFWDSEIVFDLGVNLPENLKNHQETWSYHWELRDLDGNVINKGLVPIQGDSTLNVTNKGFRRKFRRWNSGKTRAFVLPELHPHKEYILWASFIKGDNLKSGMLRIASFTIEDRTSYQMQLFLILVTIIASLSFAGLFKNCGA